MKIKFDLKLSMTLKLNLKLRMKFKLNLNLRIICRAGKFCVICIAEKFAELT